MLELPEKFGLPADTSSVISPRCSSSTGSGTKDGGPDLVKGSRNNLSDLRVLKSKGLSVCN